MVPKESITLSSRSLLWGPPRVKTPIDERVDWGEDGL